MRNLYRETSIYIDSYMLLIIYVGCRIHTISQLHCYELTTREWKIIIEESRIVERNWSVEDWKCWVCIYLLIHPSVSYMYTCYSWILYNWNSRSEENILWNCRYMYAWLTVLLVFFPSLLSRNLSYWHNCTFLSVRMNNISIMFVVQVKRSLGSYCAR